MQSVTVGTNQAGQRLDKFLHKCLPNAGSSFLYKMLRKKNITLNGKKAEGKEILSLGDEIMFFFSEETFEKFAGKEKISFMENGTNTGSTQYANEYRQAYGKIKGIKVLYEDENILIVNKPVGVLTQKAAQEDISLNEWLIGYLLAHNVITEEELHTFHPSVCNRLDRNTSGIVLCGKSLAGSQALSRIIKERTLQKFYHTLCVGELRKKEFLDGYLHKDTKTNKVTVCKAIPTNAVTKDYSPIRTGYIPVISKKEYTLLEVELITGKTHQIRSHLAFVGHPIVGDGKYGNSRINRKFRDSDRLQHQLLHAYRIIFPQEKEGVLAALSGKEIQAEYPPQFQKIVKRIFSDYN